MSNTSKKTYFLIFTIRKRKSMVVSLAWNVLPCNWWYTTKAAIAYLVIITMPLWMYSCYTRSDGFLAIPSSEGIATLAVMTLRIHNECECYRLRYIFIAAMKILWTLLRFLRLCGNKSDWVMRGWCKSWLSFCRYVCRLQWFTLVSWPP